MTNKLRWALGERANSRANSSPLCYAENGDYIAGSLAPIVARAEIAEERAETAEARLHELEAELRRLRGQTNQT